MFQSKRVSFPFQYFIRLFVVKVVLDFFVAQKKKFFLLILSMFQAFIFWLIEGGEYAYEEAEIGVGRRI